MRAVIQRVEKASVVILENEVAKIEQGLLVLLGIEIEDANEDAKEELDFKKLDTLSDLKKIGAYKHISEVIEKDEMPPKKVLEKRPQMKLTDDEKKTLMAWAKKEAETLVKSKK